MYAIARASDVYAFSECPFSQLFFCRIRQGADLYSATDSTARIYSMVKTLFRELWEGEPLRQLGVSVGRLSPNDVTQLSF